MKYRKLPVIIDAEVYHRGLEDGFEKCDSVTCGTFRNFNKTCDDCTYGLPYILTLEGKMFITDGDFIITGVKGEKYPCKPDIFNMTYEEVVSDGNAE
jgi:hypothetical protein